MLRTKYIIFEDNGLEDIIVFSGLQKHDSIARRLGLRPISAGFFVIDADGIPKCYGESTSLKLESREEDTKIAKRAIDC